nr:protein STAY-GREEN, chloroplastic-like isoform X1 [Ipomoea trifida]
MGTLGASLLLPTKPIIIGPEKKGSQFVFRERSSKNRSVVPVARLFGPSIFEASKLKVLFLGVDEEKHPGKLPRTYTLTHSDITSKITLAISQTINSSQLQGWYNRLQRDEVVAEWKKVKGKMSLHVHCHISGGHFLLNLCAKLRFYIFCKELPVVLKAFVHGDGNLLKNHPELQDSLVWVYFHSIIEEFNRVECWGPLKEAASPPPPPQPSIAADGGSSGGVGAHTEKTSLLSNWEIPQPCHDTCNCCFPSTTSIPWTASSYSSRGPFGPLGTNEPIHFGPQEQNFR